MPDNNTAKQVSDATGTLWAYIQNWAARGISLLVFFVLVRVLSPAEFGTFAITMVFITVGEIFVEQLFGHAIVQRKELTESHLSSAFWATLLLGLVMAVGSLVAAPYFASAFDSPGAAPLVMAITPVFIFMALNSVPAALLFRELNYRTLTRRTALSNLLSGIAAIAAAISGWGVWTFVLQQLVFQAVSTAVLWRNEAWRPKTIFNSQALGELFSFSSRVTAGKLLDLLETRVVELIIARYLGIVAVGNFSLAARAQQAATQLLASPLWVSSIAVFARKQTDKQALVGSLRERIHLAALFIAPVFLFAAASADSLVPAVFGRQWIEAIVPFQILCLLSAIRSMTVLLGSALQAIGVANASVWTGLTRTGAVLASIPALIDQGINGIAICLVIGQIASLPVLFGFFSKLFGTSIRQIFSSAYLPIFLAAVTALVGLIFTKNYPTTNSPLVGAAITLLLCGVLFSIGVVLFMKNTLVATIAKFLKFENKARLSGAFGERNFGDDLLMLVAHDFLRRKNDFQYFVTVNDIDKSRYIKSLVPHAALDKKYGAWRSNWITEVLPGGTQFYSFPKNKKTLHSNSQFKSKLNAIKEYGFGYAFSKLFSKIISPKPTRLAIGIGVGPFQSGNEEDSKRVLSTMTAIWLRDEESTEYPKKWGLTNTFKGADICFTNGILSLPKIVEASDKQTIGVIFRGWEYSNYTTNYETSLLQSIERLRSSGREIKLFSFCEPVDEKLISFFVENGFEVSVWNPDRTTIQDYLSQLSQCAYFLSARFHGIVIGAILGKPSIGIALDPKVKQIAKKLGLEDYVWESPFDSERLTALVADMDREYEVATQTVVAARMQEGIVADEMMEAAAVELTKMRREK